MLYPPRSTVPMLRQFARAVVGDRLLGDEIVRMAMVGGSPPVPANDPVDMATGFALFFQAWREMAASKGGTAPLFSDARLAGALPPLACAPEKARRALVILVDILGVPLRQAASWLGLGRDGPRQLVMGRREVSVPAGADILLIEDDPLIASDIASFLLEIGCQSVDLQGSAQGAIEAARQSSPSLIISDYRLKGEDSGLDAVRAICEAMPAPVVFLTGFPDQVLLGQDDFEPDFVLPKPFSPRALQTAVAHALDLRRR